MYNTRMKAASKRHLRRLFKKGKKNGLIISVQAHDLFCGIKPFTPIQITSFSLSSPPLVVGCRFRNIATFFEEPLSSADVLDTCLVVL